MQIPKYISPSGLDCWDRNKEKFYTRYLADVRQRDTFTSPAMSIGSAFDAQVKTKLCNDLNIPCDTARELFEKQVTQEHWEWGWLHSQYIMNQYVGCGAYIDLLRELEKSVVTPNFEFKASCNIEGVPIFGYPDCAYMNEGMRKVSLDWKVNGYCGKNGGKPKAHYLTKFPERISHKKCSAWDADGTIINVGCSGLEAVDKQWAAQQCMYNWMMGASVGENFIVTLEQLVGMPNGTEFPDVTVYRYRSCIGKDFQNQLRDRLVNAWEIIHSGWIFRDMSREASLEKQESLENMTKMAISEDPTDRMMASL